MRSFKLILTPVILFSLMMSMSAQKVDYIYTSPVMNSGMLNPEQTIALKTGYEFSPSSVNYAWIRINGELEKSYDFSRYLSDDGKTLILKPNRNFLLGDEVVVKVPGTLKTIDGKKIEPLTLNFRIREHQKGTLIQSFQVPGPGREGEEPPSALPPLGKYTFPDLYPADFPVPTVTHYDETSNDYLFMSLNPRTTDYAHYLAIFDKFGIPVFYRRMPSNYSNLFPLGDGNLAFARNPQNAPSLEKFFLMDANYEVFDSILCGNGYDLDFHDMLLLDNGNYLVMSYDPQIVDMSQIVPGGHPDATVVGLIIQEVDNQQNVYFQWRSWDHFEITDATSDISLTSNYIDYVHGNAFDIDLDGNILVSSRHLDEITKINFTTGDVMWRFGLLAQNNEFTIVNDPLGFSHQHDVRVLPNGNITIFDNGNLRNPQYSQAIEYDIDEDDMIATRVWYYQRAPSVFATHTGSHRRQADGTSLIGWGTNYPLAVTEVHLNGNKTFELFLPDLVSSYRVVRSPWETTLFSVRSNLHFGNYSTNSDPKILSVLVTNNAEHSINISTHHNHSEFFFLDSELPIVIPAGQTKEFFIGFIPSEQGEFSDVLTLDHNVASLIEAERISRQIHLIGIWNDDLPAVSFDPTFGSVSIDPSTEVVIEFSEPVKLAFGGEITSQNIPTLFYFRETDLNGAAMPFAGTINDEKTLVTLYPSTILDENQLYYVEMKANLLMDYDGNVLNYPEITRFTTGELVSVDNPVWGQGIKIYPQPFSDRLFIETTGMNVKAITIIDATGTVIREVTDPTVKMSLETSGFATGIYFLEFTGENGGREVYKVLKGSH